MNRFIRVLTISWIALSCSTAAMAQNSRRDSRDTRESYADKYGPITDHNVFLKDRTIRPNRQQTKTTQPTRTAEESLVLRGVALEDGGVRAYVEDVDAAKMLKLNIGDAVGRGTLSDIAIDAVCYERNGEQIWIEAGADFTGKQIVAIVNDSPSAAATTGPAEIINPNDPNLTLEQRMKLKRMQERAK